MEKLLTIFLLFLLAPLTAFTQAKNKNEKEAVLQTIQTLFDAMAEADSAKAADLFLKDGHSFRVQGQGNGKDSVEIRLSPHRSFISSIGGWKQKIVERMWDARVLVKDGIAMVWTPYDLYIDGTFSHCGIDLFSLIKTEEGWKIADITYTVKQKIEKCEENPPGPLK